MLIYKSRYEYETLEKHFTCSKKNIIHKRLPRKLKKSINNFILNGNNSELYRSKDYKLNLKMWYLGWFINPDLNSFKIKKITENKNNWNWHEKG